MKLTKQEAYIKHYQVWDLLFKHPTWDKWDVSGEIPDLKKVFNSCFLCELVVREGISDFFVDEEKHCPKCPLYKAIGQACDWSFVNNKGGWYYYWKMSNESRARTKYAKLIRDCVLPFLTEKSKKLLFND